MMNNPNKDPTIALGFTKEGRIIAMRVGEYGVLWNWCINVKNAIRGRRDVLDTCHNWFENNYDVTNGKKRSKDLPEDLDRKYKRYCRALVDLGVCNYDIISVSLLRVGDGMETPHLD